MITRGIRVLVGVLVVTTLTGCASTDESTRPTPVGDPGNKPATEEVRTPPDIQRPLPGEISYSNAFQGALARGTRTESGRPGADYWQQSVDYTIEAELLPAERRLEGGVEIDYQNNSPDTLRTLHVDLLQNVHSPGVKRNIAQEITGGVELHTVVAEGDTLVPRSVGTARYSVTGTRMIVHPREPVAPGESTRLNIDYAFTIPQVGASGRMGYSDGLFHIAYWYPQVAVYDDLNGWHPDHYLGLSEFYYDFGDYDMTITLPEGWIVHSTGELQNPEEVLTAEVRERLDEARRSDEPVRVVSDDDFNGGATTDAPDDEHRWRFTANRVRDVAFSATRASYWDAARAPVGDRDGDGNTDYTRVDAVYRSSAPLWKRSAEYLQHSISFLSDHLDFPYPYAHMTAVEGGNIIGGGMEFPMMTLVGDYNTRGDSALYAVILHELSHMWIPMIVSTDERRYSWIDEGTTTFNENMGKGVFFEDKTAMNFVNRDRSTYLQFANSDAAGEAMRWSNYHYTREAFIIASYQKPATVLVALREVLGEETFEEALHTFVDTWAYKHPTPYDFFNTFETVSGRELDWFWHSWYYETWTLDHAIANVNVGSEETTITVQDNGNAVMPVHADIHHADGTTTTRTVSVDRWLQGHRRATITVPSTDAVTRIELDADHRFPDVDRSNNTWTR